MAGVLQHLRSSTLNKRPNPASMVDGQIAINYASGSPGAFFKDTNGNLVKVGPVHVGATAPNVSPASGGTAGNSLGEQWLDTSGGTYVFKIWDGAAWRSEAGEFVNSTGDTMTGSLTMGPSANLIFEGSTDDGFETTLTVVDPTADRTITLPNVSGTVVTTGDSGTVTSTMIADGTIVNADVNASAAIAGTKISPDFGSQTIQTTGVFSHAVGSAGAPTIAFTGDTNTGIYSPGADQVAISTGGSGRLFIGSTGAVGVGASDPGYALDVAAADTTAGLGYALRLRANSTAGAAAIQFTNNPVSAEYSVIAGDSSNNLKFLTSGSERLRIASNGQVSIGTSAAKAPLHLFGAGQTTASITDAGARGCFLRLSDNSAAAGAGGAILFANVQGDNANSLGFAAIKGLLIDGTNNTRGDISFSTRGNNTDSSLTERMRIAADGAVGIGRAPAYTLDVAGSARIGAATGEASLELGTGATGNRTVYIDFVGDTTYTDYGFRILRTNEGANAPTFLEHRGTGDFAFNTTEAAPIIFRTNSSERLRITPAGYIGIGQSTPSTRLHISDGEFTISTGGNVPDAGGIINFGISQLSTFSPMATIQGLLSNAAGTELQGGLGFFTRPAGTAGQTLQRRMTITDAGNVGIGTTSPSYLLDVAGTARIGATTGDATLKIGTGASANRNAYIDLVGDTTYTDYGTRIIRQAGGANADSRIQHRGTGALALETAEAGASIVFLQQPGERARIDSSGRLLVGTSSAAQYNSYSNNNLLQLAQGSGSPDIQAASFRNDQFGTVINLCKSRSNTLGTNTAVQDGDWLGTINFTGANGTSWVEGARITGFAEGQTWANGDCPARLVFSTTADGASSPTERMRITSAGTILIAKTADDINTQGIRLSQFGVGSFCRDAEIPLFVNRNTDDGGLVVFRQDGVDEGSISVSGTTVSYNGAHLSRWSQLPSGAERTEILRGTVLSNIDEMCEWGDEGNEQLNRMKVSDVEGDKNVSGVFQGWDDDDDTYTNDFYCAMTGDFIIRIGAGVTVERGDLLMSAGDGTAKPQDDDIIRSKTIAKVTSTNVSCTYDDGSYCVPCVLMAC